jgi:hypothetical protein
MAGIVIGVLAAIAIACLATFFLMRRRPKEQATTSQAYPYYAKPELGEQANSTPATELPGEDLPQELPVKP